MDVFNLLTSGAAGGLFGIIGSIGGRIIGIWETREKRKDQAAAYQHEIDLTKLQAQARAEETEHEIAILSAQMSKASNDGSWAGLQASIAAQADSQASSGWVRDLLALVRPGLTAVLLVAMIATVWWLNARGLAPENYNQLIADSVNNLTFAAMTALFWWFGDRAPTHPGKLGGSK